MKTPEAVGISVTVGIVLLALGYSVNPTDFSNLGSSDGKVYGCGAGTFYHIITNSCELFPEKVVWMIAGDEDDVTVYHKQSDGTWKSQDEIMEEQKKEFNQ